MIPAACFVDRESPVTCARSEPEPDLAVFAGAPEDFRHAHPATAELVIEIAINTRQRDLDKAAVCAGAGVKEYWLIEPEAGASARFTEPSAEGYGRRDDFAAGDEAVSTVFPGFRFRLAAWLGA
ncbi:MAG TPA: Uma2 family endonuclease [Prosthecobacter sp.]|nr:Uma2 family endonuclease [Prosthecobacter sp.]HRK15384.1 Uma2 family endonuclease [Prosthecobacter sp.]